LEVERTPVCAQLKVASGHLSDGRSHRSLAKEGNSGSEFLRRALGATTFAILRWGATTGTFFHSTHNVLHQKFIGIASS
jgi:hypothetical protein